MEHLSKTGIQSYDLNYKLELDVSSTEEIVRLLVTFNQTHRTEDTNILMTRIIYLLTSCKKYSQTQLPSTANVLLQIRFCALSYKIKK